MNLSLSPSVEIETDFGRLSNFAAEFGPRREHLDCALFSANAPGTPWLRVQYGCAQGRIFHSHDCDCQAQIESSLTMLADAPAPGLFVYFRDHEAYGLGSINKLKLLRDEAASGKSYAQLVAEGRYPPPDNGVLAAIPPLLDALKMTRSVVLLSNSVGKLGALRSYGVSVVRTVDIDKPGWASWPDPGRLRHSSRSR